MSGERHVKIDHDSEQGLIEIKLNGFVRRTDKTQALKELIAGSSGILKRKGRSRDWLLRLPEQNIADLIALIYQSDQSTWLWIAKRLAVSRDSQKTQISGKSLIAYAREHPSLTVNQLVEATNCTLTEARRAMDHLEWD